MFKLFLYIFLKKLNAPYNNINNTSLTKFIDNDDLRKDIISYKQFFHIWRKKLDNEITNECYKIKKLKLYRRSSFLIIKTKLIHSFIIKNHLPKKTSYEALNYIFLIKGFKIIDMASFEYEPDKYKKLFFTTSFSNYNLKSKFTWTELLENIDDMFNCYIKLNDKTFITEKYRNNKSYSRDSAVSYARKHAFNYNSAYEDFNNRGGDCTNFISQCLYSGGIPLSRTWKPYTNPWIRVNELYSYLTRNSLSYEVSSLSSLDKGDLIQFFSNSKGYFAHSGIISEILDNGEILYCCHTYDKLDFPLSEIYPLLYTKIRLLKISY